MIYDGQVIANSVAYAALGNWFIQKVKNSEWIPFINKQTYWINKAFAAVVALIAAIGITYTYTWNPEGVLSITLSGLTFMSVWAGFKTFVVSYALQQTGYHITKSREEGTEK